MPAARLKIHNLLFSDLTNLIFPNLCAGCGSTLVKHEKLICLGCLHNTPKTDFVDRKDNALEKLFWGKSNITAGMALYYFQKQGVVQKLFHSLKYEGKKEIGEFLGELVAKQLVDSERFENIEEIVAVPLHPKRERYRGYNQSEWIGRGISKALGLALPKKNLVRLKYTESQTKKSKAERWKNVEDVFAINDKEKLKGKNILLIDDVVTTGSTLTACANELNKIEGINLYVATVAIATD